MSTSPAGPASKDIVRAFYESHNRGDIKESWERYVAPQVTVRGRGETRSYTEWLATAEYLYAALQDVKVAVLDQVAEGAVVATRLAITGTQTGPLFGVEASGNVATLNEVIFDTVQDGRIVEHSAENDVEAFLAQLSG